MKAVLLAAGRGSRLQDRTKELPKLLVEVDGRSILQRQLDSLAPLIADGAVDEEVVIVLGHGFADVDEDEPARSEKVREHVLVDDRFEYRVVILPDWDEVENAASALAALETFDDDALLLCGDVITTETLLRNVVETFENEHEPAGYSTVGAVEGIQTQMTAVLADEDDVITDYGAIDGHREVGVFVLNREHAAQARSILESNPDDWFPIVFPEVPSRMVTVDPTHQIEINTEEHFREAERAVPLEADPKPGTSETHLGR